MNYNTPPNIGHMLFILTEIQIYLNHRVSYVIIILHIYDQSNFKSSKKKP
jgi:hypothetical protein